MKHYFINILKTIFAVFGLEIKKKFCKNYANVNLLPRVTLFQILDHLVRLGFKPATIIDVGAANGTFELYTQFPSSKHILIEPLIEFEKDLKHITDIYDAEYVIAAAGEKKRNVIINVHPDLVGSSIFNEVEGASVDGFARNIPMITLEDVCKERMLKGCYLIKIDVQGAELLVLEGAKNILQDTEVIILEVSLIDCVLGSPLLHDVVGYMEKRGFVVYDFFNFNYRPLDNALAQIDAVFVKENGMFRKDRSFATLTQRSAQFKSMLDFVNSRKRDIHN